MITVNGLYSSACHNNVSVRGWAVKTQSLQDMNTTSHISNCTMPNMLDGLNSSLFDVAVHPMTMDSDCDSCTWAYPLTSNGLVMVPVDDQSERLSIFLNVFPNKVWYCIGAVASAFMISAVMGGRRADSITSHIVFQSVGEHAYP
jgi:hypothetical protein